MRYTPLLLLAIFILFSPHNAQAQNTVKGCFESETTNGGIAFCLTLLNKDLIAIKNTIENELIEMVEKDMFLPKPDYEEIETYPSISISSAADIGIRKAQEKQISLQEKKNLLEKKRHKLKKRDFIDKLQESKKLSDQYIEIACNIRKDRFTCLVPDYGGMDQF